MTNCSDNLYVIRYTDSDSGTITIVKSALVSDVVDITLVGKTRREYGEVFNENLLHLLEGFACPEDPSDTSGLTPDYTVAFGELLENPIVGQRWFNSTRKVTNYYDGSAWVPFTSADDVVGVSGIIFDGQYLPRPVDSQGYVFPYSECIFTVSPMGFFTDEFLYFQFGEIDYMNCTVGNDGLVNARFRFNGESSLRSGLANYTIVGIRGNTNLGSLAASPYPVPSPTPGVTPTPTPTISVTPSLSFVPASPTPTPTVTATITPTPTPTPTTGSSPTPTPTRTPTPTPSGTPAVTPTKTPTPTPTRTPTPTPSGAQLLASVSFVSGCTISGGCCDVGPVKTDTPDEIVDLTAVVSGQGSATLTYTWTYLNSTSGGPLGAIAATTPGSAQATLTSPYGSSDTDSTFGAANFRLTVNASDGRSAIVDFCISGTARGGAWTAGGGPGCVAIDSYLMDYDRADETVVGDYMKVIDPVTYRLGEGLVTVSRTEMQPCVRIVTEGGASLVCSTTGPIADEFGNAVLAPDLLGVRVPVFENGMVSAETVTEVTHVGIRPVRYITCENNFFLAGEQQGKYLLHHNLKDDTP